MSEDKFAEQQDRLPSLPADPLDLRQSNTPPPESQPQPSPKQTVFVKPLPVPSASQSSPGKHNPPTTCPDPTKGIASSNAVGAESLQPQISSEPACLPAMSQPRSSLEALPLPPEQPLGGRHCRPAYPGNPSDILPHLKVQSSEMGTLLQPRSEFYYEPTGGDAIQYFDEDCDRTADDELQDENLELAMDDFRLTSDDQRSTQNSPVLSHERSSGGGRGYSSDDFDDDSQHGRGRSPTGDLVELNWTQVRVEHDQTSTNLHVHVHLPQLIEDHIFVFFSEKGFRISFQSNSAEFRARFAAHLPADQQPNYFLSGSGLFDRIQPKDCSYRVLPEQLDLNLSKAIPVPWETLFENTASLKSKLCGSYLRHLGSKATAFDESACRPVESAASPAHHSRLQARRCASPLAGLEADASLHMQPSCSRTDDGDLVEPRFWSRRSALFVPAIGPAPEPEETSSGRKGRVGFTGLDNLGNTCFMNAILQCLSNTDELRDFFMYSSFREQLNCENPFGSGGKLSIGFHELAGQLWNGSNHSYSPKQFKNLAGDRVNAFSDNRQHDALEYMEHFLDMLHEDVNRIDRRKPIVDTPPEIAEDQMSDEQFAKEMWMRHRRRNDSVVIDLFHGQLKSKLVCPVCEKRSLTFDPFLYLPVPLPKELTVYSVFFYCKQGSRKPSKIIMRLPQESKVSTLLDAVAAKTQVPAASMRLFVFDDGQIESELSSGQVVPTTTGTQLLSVFETHSHGEPNEEIFNLLVHQRLESPAQPGRCSNCRQAQPPQATVCAGCRRTVYCDADCQRQDWEEHRSKCRLRLDPVGYPFLLSIPRSEMTYEALVERMFKCSRYSVDVTDPSSLHSDRVVEESPDSFSLLGSTNWKKVGDGAYLPVSLPGDQSRPIAADLVQPTSPDTSVATGQDSEPSEMCIGSLPRSTPMMSAMDAAADANARDQVVPGDALESLGSATTEAAADAEHRVEPSEATSLFAVSLESANEAQRSLGAHQHRFHVGLQPDEPDAPLDEQHRLSEERCGDPEALAALLRQCGRLVMDWKNGPKVNQDMLVESKELDHSCHFYDAKRPGGDDSVHTLDDCLRIFTEPEILSLEDSWHCPQCKKPQEACKQLTIWRLPQLLVFQLKRFSYKNSTREKIKKFVKFPLHGLDMSSFCSPREDPAQTQRAVYDLYAVVNHYGGIYGGHYTAAAKSEFEGRDMGWRTFDDYHVEETSEASIVTKNAYILFYRLRREQPDEPMAAE